MANTFNASLTLQLINKVSRPAKKVDTNLGGLGDRTEQVTTRMRSLARELDAVTARLRGMTRAVRQLAREERRVGGLAGLGDPGGIGGGATRRGRSRGRTGARAGRGRSRAVRRTFMQLSETEQIAQVRGQEQTKARRRQIRNDLGYGAKPKTSGGHFFRGANLAQTAQAMDRVSMGLQRVGTDITQTSVDFEKGVTRIEGITGEGFQGASIREEVLKNARLFGDTQGQVEAYYQTVSAGAKDAGEAQAILSAANRLAIVDNSDVATSIDGITSALNAYGLGADKAEAVAGTFFAAVRDGKTTVDEISNSIGRVAPTARQLGVGIDQLAASFGTATKLGIKQSEVASGLKAAFSNILKPTRDAQEEAKKLGIDFSKKNLQEKGLGGFLEEIATAKKKSGEGADLEKLFGSVEAFNAIAALAADDLETFNAVLQDTKDGTTDLGKAFEKSNETTAQKLARAEAQFDELKITLGDSLIPVLTEVLDATMPLVQELGAWAKQNPQTVAGLVKVGAGLFAISKAGAVTADVMAGAQGVAGGLKAVRSAGQGLDAVLSSKLGPNMRALTGVAGVAAAAFVGWKIGRWIDEMTGASDWIANEIARWSGMQPTKRVSDRGLGFGEGDKEATGSGRAAALRTRARGLQETLSQQETDLAASRKGMEAFSQSRWLNDMLIGAGTSEQQIEQTKKELAEVQAQLAAIQGGGKNAAVAQKQNAQLELTLKDERSELKVKKADGFDVNALRSG